MFGLGLVLIGKSMDPSVSRPWGSGGDGLPVALCGSASFPSTWVSKVYPCGPKAALSVKTAGGEHVAPAEVAASIGGGEAVPGLGCNGHLHAQGRRDGHGTHIQGLQGGVGGMKGRGAAPGEQASGTVGLQ